MSEDFNNIFIPFSMNWLNLAWVKLLNMWGWLENGFLEITKGFYYKVLKTAVWAVLGVFEKVFENEFHIGFNDISEVDRVKNIGKNTHECA
jgi:hypothetical protein